MVATVRIFTSMLALVAGWGTGVLALLGAAWGVWLFLSGVDFLSARVGAPPPFVPLAALSLVVPVGVLFVTLVLYACLPARAVMYMFVASGRTQRLPNDHALVAQTRALAERLHMGTPAVYLYASNNLNAWALSTLTGSVVAVSTGLINSLSPAQCQWVLAHELAHVKHFDSGSSAFWMAANRTVWLGWRIHHWVIGGTANVLGALGLHHVLWVILCAPLLVISYTLILADGVSRGVFRAMDRFIGRAMEHRADRVASELLGATTGIATLSKFPTGIEPTFGIFATHPPMHGRLRRLRRLRAAERARAAGESASNGSPPPGAHPSSGTRSSPAAAPVPGAGAASGGRHPFSGAPPANAARTRSTHPSGSSRT